MRVIDVIQGTPEWLAHRMGKRNASDAPAMMGCTPNKSRGDLVRELATGVAPEFSDFVQRRILDKGHEFERLARPLAEEFAGEEFSPLSAVADEDPRYAASFDGIDFAETVSWEHKRLNADLRAVMVPGCTGADLPLMYQVQMEHQCLVSKVERVLFTASDWDGDELLDIRHCWYTPNPKLRAQVMAGWEQLNKDVAAYRESPPEPAAPVVAAPVDTLPAVAVQLQGNLAVVSNLDKVAVAVRGFIDGMVAKPATDQEFADAEAECKALKKGEDAMKAAVANALAQVSDVEAFTRTANDLADLMRTTRLAREKLVTAEKDARKAALVQDAQAALDSAVADLNRQMGANWLPRQNAGFGEAIKGLKSLDSMRDKLAVALSNAKLEATTRAHTLTLNRDLLRGDGQDWIALFPDFPTVGTKEPEDFQALAALRISQHRQAEAARLDKERERIRAEEEAKAKREADEALRKQLAEAEAKVQANIAEAKQAGVVDATLLDNLSAVHKDLTADVISDIDARRVIGEAKASAAQIEGDTVTLGQLNALLAPIRIDAAGLADLGFTPSATVKAAKHYRAGDVPRICNALIQHLQGVLVTA
ncbi:endonuclease [Comamonas serinivorans]|uniref:Endonuclease n=1 Tax=Comamonas serinivorans TaxID=1082851 RepID=A0A1Y0ERN5_9BURK|nr:YqaJ viral recombinase family protein [Comamonas serinivorans]ARU06168.1 endonuclease [Comamonas serinivorans]